MAPDDVVPGSPVPGSAPGDGDGVPDTGRRQVVLVAGSGRSGTSTMAGTLQAFGFHVPQPEVQADETNPKGFGESQWVVDFHERLLRNSNVGVSDARPQAWLQAGKMATKEHHRERLYRWLERQFRDGGDEIVLKDPRLAWFIGLWRSAALRCGATPVYVTMLRPPTEVVGSKQTYYARSTSGQGNRTASWVNMMLHTERATRGGHRAFVRYHDLLDDWTIPVFELGRELDLAGVQGATANQIRKVHKFIDPSLRRVRFTWDDLQVPARLREIADETWAAMDKLAEPGGDTPEQHGTLDELRASYTELYAEAEEIALSSALAARAQAVRETALAETTPTQDTATAPAERPREASEEDPARARVPHSLRRRVPPRVRRAARRALGR